MKNPPGGERCKRVIKNRCLFALCFADRYTKGSDLSRSGSTLCPSFVPSCSVSVYLPLFLITLPCHHVSSNNLPCFFFPSSSLFLPTNDNSSINKWAEKSFLTNKSGSDFSFSTSLSVSFVSVCCSIFLCLHLRCLQSELSFNTASIHYCHRVRRNESAVA